MRIAWVTIALVCVLGGVASCLSFDDVRCADGSVCPAGSRCSDDGRCISPAQLAACSGIVDGSECQLIGGGGTCRDGACVPWVCGDGVRDPDEQCDGVDVGAATCLDFNARAPEGLACTPDCKFDVRACGLCGNSQLDPGEQCDGTTFGPEGQPDCQSFGFYTSAPVPCSAICTFDVAGCEGRCGDGIVNGPELCDGVAPAGESCIDIGYDAGRLECAQCTRGIAGCRLFGWRPIAAPGNAYLNGIWGASANDVWVVGSGGTILRGNAGGLQDVSDPTLTEDDLYAVWGSSATDVFIVGAGGTILHYDGTSLVKMSSVPTGNHLRGIWGTGPTNVYAVGASGTLLHFNGTTWSAKTTNTNEELRGIWGLGATQIFVVGTNGAALRFDGTTVTPTNPMPSSPISAKADCWAVWGTAVDNVFAVTLHDEVLRFDGTNWSYMPSPTTAQAAFTAGVVGGGANDVFAVGRTVRHFDGSRWTQVLPPSGNRVLRAMWRSPEGDVWLAGNDGYVASWGGAGWTTATASSTNELRSVAALGPSDAIAVGAGGTIRRYDGLGWSAHDAGTTELLASVWAHSPSFGVAVGSAGTIRHFGGGSTWTTPSTAPSTNGLFAVWGDATDNVLAAGNAGMLRQYAGTSWSAGSSLSADLVLLGLWGTGARRVAVGQTLSLPVRGALHEFQGTWTEVTSPSVMSTANLVGVWGSGPTDVFAVGDAILHYDGAWKPMTGTGRKLRAVSGTGPRNVFAVGDNGTLLHYDGISWTPIRVLDASGFTVDKRLRGVAATPRSVIVVGEGGFVQRLAFSLRPSEVHCRDAWDDDGDALPDCADPDCAGDVYCKDAGGACTLAATLACGDSISDSTAGRTSARDYYRCSPNAETGGDLVYKFVAPASATVTATLSSFAPADLDLVVVGEMPASAACDPDFACIDASATAAATETATFTATAGQSYYVIVDGNNGAAGPFTLSLSCP